MAGQSGSSSFLFAFVSLLLVATSSAGDDDRNTPQDAVESPEPLPRASHHTHAHNMETLLRLYDPYSLGASWQELTIADQLTEDCRVAMGHFFRELDNGTAWARQMFDSSGRYSSRFLWGNSFWLGSQTQCLQLGSSASYSVAKVRLNVTGLAKPPVRVVSLGLCAPVQCLNADVALILRGSLPASASVLRARTVPDAAYTVLEEPAFYGVIVVVLLVTLLVVAGTAFDLVLRRREKKLTIRSGHYSACCPQKPGSITTLVTQEGGGGECGGNQRSYSPEGAPTQEQQPEDGSKIVQQIGTAGQIILCFSAWTNLLKICNTRSKDSLSCVHGLRVFSLVWVIAGHTCMFAFPFSDNRNFRQLVEKDFLFQSIGNGAFSVDTFFFISGLLVTYVFFKAMDKVTGHHDATQRPGFRSSSMQFIGVFSYRFIRLTPPYLLVLGLTELTTKWFDRNSVFEPPTQDHVNCPSYWWRNALYINTLFPVNEMCMIWSWYLANDTQFYALAIVLLLLSLRYPKTAAISLVVLVLSSWVTTAIIVVNTHHVPSVEAPLGLFDALYDKPWMRLGPYAIGMGVGLVLHRTGCKLHMHKALVVVGWALSLALTFTLVHGLYGDLGPVSSAAYVALSHTAWALALAWIAMACCTGHGGYVDRFLSSPALQPLSRITYCAYLLHPVLMLAVIMHMDSPIHLARGTMVMTIFGYFVASYLGSLVLSLAVEAPVINLLNLAHPMKRKLK